MNGLSTHSEVDVMQFRQEHDILPSVRSRIPAKSKNSPGKYDIEHSKSTHAKSDSEIWKRRPTFNRILFLDAYVRFNQPLPLVSNFFLM